MKNQYPKTTAIVFDIGGVLIDWDPCYLYCDKLGMERQDVEHFFQEVGFFPWNTEQDLGRPFAEATEELSTRFPQYRRLIEAFDQRYLETIAGAIQPSVDIVYKLKEAGYPLFTLSNWSAEKFSQVRPQYPFFDCFDEMIISGKVKLVKPGREIFDLLLERTGCPAAECLFIDDHAVNTDAAQALGFQTILFQSGEQLAAELRQRGLLNHSA